MDDELVYAKIKEQFVKHKLFHKLKPNEGGLEEYAAKLNSALPDIYRELKENGALPEPITYDLFMRACQWGLETAEARYFYGPHVEIRR